MSPFTWMNFLCEMDHYNSHLTDTNMRLTYPVESKQNEELLGKVLSFI